MLNPNETIQMPRFRPRTPPGRPLEVGWGQEVGRWLWHLFVLPAELAKPWPSWVHRFIKPPLFALAREVSVSNPRSLRSWFFGLMLLKPPRGDWASQTQYMRARSRRPLELAALLKHVLYPHFYPVKWVLSQRIEEYSRALTDAVSRAPRAAKVVLGTALAVFFAVSVTTPLTLGEQFVFLGGMWGIAMLVRYLHGYGPGIIMMTMSVIASSRYMWWRMTQSMALGPGLETVLGVGLFFAECYTWLIMVLGYIQNARPLRRKPVPLPLDRSIWPSVDIYIPSYNEPLKVVRPTVLAALNLDWPAEKLNIYLLDDGRRDEFRDFAAACGVHYVTRTNNAHAKAGNLNHALTLTHGEFIAIFDCDHIPVRTFLTTTMGWFLRDPQCAMMQTPHHFFSPDPFERNLGTFRRVPNEGNLFYGLIQDGNDLWNAAFFCGSCAVLRRGPLEEVGGIAVETVTEDAHTALKLHRRGYNTAYLREVLAGGLATESLSGHIGQRIRWARGMAQIFRLDNPFFGKGLNLFQRLCYSNAMLHFFSGIPRLVFLTAPLAYLYFQVHIINAAAVTLAAYALPHLTLSTLANSHLQGRFRHSFWNEAYEAVLSWYIARPTTVALINPRLGKFNVTAKGGLVEQDFFDWRIAVPYLLLVLLNAGGALIAIPRLFVWNSFEADTVTINLIWTLFNLTLLGAVLGVASEARQVRAAHRVNKSQSVTLYLADGERVACETSDFSMQGLGLKKLDTSRLKPGDAVHVGLFADGQEYVFPLKIMVVRADRLGLQLAELSIKEERDYVRCTFAAPDAWRDWGQDAEVDHPLASFAEVFSFGATGYVRLLESLQTGLLGWWRSPSRGSSI
jgi:cellulose synthase (UDP-forming)